MDARRPQELLNSESCLLRGGSFFDMRLVKPYVPTRRPHTFREVSYPPLIVKVAVSSTVASVEPLPLVLSPPLSGLTPYRTCDGTYLLLHIYYIRMYNKTHVAAVTRSTHAQRTHRLPKYGLVPSLARSRFLTSEAELDDARAKNCVRCFSDPCCSSTVQDGTDSDGAEVSGRSTPSTFSNRKLSMIVVVPAKRANQTRGFGIRRRRSKHDNEF